MWLMFIGLFGSMLLLNMIYTVIAPFYPIIAESKGTPLWLIGQIFTLLPVVTFLVTPFVSRQIRVIGFKSSINTGLFFAVTST